MPLSAKFESDTQSIWGGSLVKGDNGLYHMYYSRWPVALLCAADTIDKAGVRHSFNVQIPIVTQ